MSCGVDSHSPWHQFGKEVPSCQVFSRQLKYFCSCFLAQEEKRIPASAKKAESPIPWIHPNSLQQHSAAKSLFYKVLISHSKVHGLIQFLRFLRLAIMSIFADWFYIGETSDLYSTFQRLTRCRNGWRQKQGLAPESCAWWIFALKHEGAKSDDWRWGDCLDRLWRSREVWSGSFIHVYTFEPTWKEVEGDSIYDFKVNFDVGQGKMRELADERYGCLQICRETCKVGAWSQKDVVGMGVLFVLARCRILMDKKCPWTSTMARLSWSSTLPVNEANMSPMISHDSPAQPSRASRPMLFPRFLHTFARSDEVKLCWTVPTQMLFPEIDLSLNCLKFHNLFQNFTKSRIEFFRAFSCVHWGVSCTGNTNLVALRHQRASNSAAEPEKWAP